MIDLASASLSAVFKENRGKEERVEVGVVEEVKGKGKKKFFRKNKICVEEKSGKNQENEKIDENEKSEKNKMEFAFENEELSFALTKPIYSDSEIGSQPGQIPPSHLLNNNYKKRLNFTKTLHNLQSDSVKLKHATSELKEDSNLYKYPTVLLANYFFLLRIVSYQIILVSLPYNPMFQILLLLIFEIIYVGLLLKNYIRHGYINSLHVFLSKIFQSGFLGIFLFLCLVIRIWFFEKPVPKFVQKIGMWSLMVAVGLEYFFLLVYFVILIVSFCKEKFGKKKLKKKKLKKKFWFLNGLRKMKF